MENLLAAIRATVHIPDEQALKFKQILTRQTYNKGDVFIREGTVPQKLAFVDRGLFRYYYVDEKGSEFTKGFFAENSFLTSYTAMIRERPSYYTIEALEASSVFVFTYADWKQLNANQPCWNSFLISMLEKGYSKKENRERELLLLTAEERYRSFLREYPLLEKRIKQHQVASYLGITPVALSRIRKDMH